MKKHYARIIFTLKSLLKGLFNPSGFSNSSRLFLSVILLLFIANNTSGQILLAGTSFDPINPADANARAFIGMTEIVQTGFQTGVITVAPPITPNTNPNIFNGTFQHAVTNNPYKLDNARYKDITATPDYQLVVSPALSGQTNILSYKVTGLAPGTPVQVRVTYCSAISPTNTAGCNIGEVVSLRGVINPDASNLNNGQEGTQVSAGGATAGGCTTMIITQATSNSNPIGANGEMNFRLNTQQNGACKAVAITNIEVWGTPLPKAISSDGVDVCAGEQIAVQTTQKYNGTYQWQVNTGSGWSNISGANASSALYEALTVRNYQFRSVITPLPSGTAITSDPVSVAAITCCTENGAPASRQTIYYDNFGRLDLTNTAGTSYFTWDYSNPLNPVEVPNTTATPFRWPLSPAPLGALFNGGPGTIRAGGYLEDGEYTVAAYLTGYNYPVNGYNGARLEWANRVTGQTATPNPDLTYDHSGAADGGALFLNCPPNTGGQTLYSRTIPSLCLGKQLFFECWIAVFTNAATGPYNGVDVLVRLTDGGNAANVVTATATANRQADGGGVWVKISAQITLVGNSLLMEIVNNKNTSIDGNDLVLDDIKIMACSPPPIDLYFDLALAQTDVICQDATEPLFTIPSAMLKTYYGNNPLYLYQWTRTPLDVNSWTNLGSPQTAESFIIPTPRTHPSFDGLTNGGKVYFRVIAATAAEFAAKSNFQGTPANSANINDPCKNYSVSTAIEALVDCPLPVELINFTATNYSGNVLLSWSTAWEQNNEHFNIERSSDGIHFETIGRTEGKGNIEVTSTYMFNDNSVPTGNVYYRLAQYDIDGTVTYSPIRMIHSEKLYQVFVSPNPNSGSFNLSFQGESGLEVKISIYNTVGQLVYETSVNPSSENYSTDLNIHHLPTGIYLLHVEGSNEKSITKIIKE